MDDRDTGHESLHPPGRKTPKHWEEARNAWSRTARRLGGQIETFTDQEGVEVGGKITVALDAVDMVVSHDERYGWTRFDANAPDSTDLSLSVWPRFHFRLKPQHRQQPFTIDERRAWDEMLAFAGNQPDRARAWLDADILDMLSFTNGYAFLLEDDRLVVEKRAMELYALDLENAMTAAAALASAGTRTYLPRWQELAGGLDEGKLLVSGEYWRPGKEDLISWKVDTRDARLLVSRERFHRHVRGAFLSTQIRLDQVAPSFERYVVSRRDRFGDLQRVELADSPFSQRYRLFSNEPKTSRNRFSTAICQKLLQLQPQYVENNGEVVCVALKGIVMDAARIAHAGRIADELARPVSANLYR